MSIKSLVRTQTTLRFVCAAQLQRWPDGDSMNTWDDFENEARLVEKTTSDQDPDTVMLLKNSIGVFADGFSASEGSSDTADDILAKMSLLSHSFGTLKCSADTALRGYYVQSMNLLRIVYENWIAFKYIEKNPDKAVLWLRASKKKKPPGHAAMLKEIDQDYTLLKGKMKDWYKTLCSFAHPDPLNLLSQISTVEVLDETSIHFGTTFKKDLFRTSAYSIFVWTGISIMNVSPWVPKGDKWHTQMADVQEGILKFVDQENKAFNPKES